MTDRIPLDHLTSDQYDQLCDQLDRLRADIAACRAQQWPQRLGHAEKALNRVRRLAEFTRDHTAPARDDMSLAQHELACAVLAALDEPGPAPTQATEPARWLHAGTRDLSIPDPEPSGPTQCSGEEGFCPERGLHELNNARNTTKEN